jgi:hypothetical protein
LGEESGDVTAEESFGVVGERPVELRSTHDVTNRLIVKTVKTVKR